MTASTKNRMLAVIPAFNEAANVGHVVAEARALQLGMDLLVVDDGSTDRTAEVATAAGATVLRLPYNCGIGATVQAGIAYAVERGYSIIVRFDADGQHDPRNVERFLALFETGAADFVLGSRYLDGSGYQSTLFRRLGARWFSALLRIVCDVRVTDPTSGFWMANLRAAKVFLSEHAADYPEVDSLVTLRRNGCTIRECSVTMRPRNSGFSSVRGLSVFYYMLKVTIGLVIGRVRTRLAASTE